MGINIEVFPKGREDPKRMIRRFIKKCKKDGFLREVVERQRYKKPSEFRRLKKKKRAGVLKKLREEYENNMRD